MTSIEWFYDEIKHIIPNDFLPKYEEAKKMHKQEIIDAHVSGYDCSGESGEDYYQETFKKD
jgi:hypothetical protein